jgi:DNA topoisomerase-1
VGEGGPGNTASLPEDLAPADVTIEKAMALVHAKAAGPRELGVDPASRQKVYLANGRFGPYVQLGETPEKTARDAAAEKPRRASLPRGETEATIDLPTALKLLSLPRDLGLHPETRQPVVSAIGRFGPYVKHGDEFRSLAPDDDVYTIDLGRAVALLAEPKQPRRRQSAAKTVLRQLGARADSSATVTLYEGRYGPYVSDGQTNASLPKGADPANIGLNEAVELLNARAAAGPKKKGGRGRAAAGGGVRAKKVAARPRRKKEPVGA